MVKYQKPCKEVQELRVKIEELREKMYHIIQIKSDLVDSEIITISQEIDLILNKYYEL